MGTADNILENIKLLEDQKLQYILAVWTPETKNDKDVVNLYTNFEKGEVKKLIEVLKGATVDAIQKKP
jgi:hypothetical protein